MPLPPRAGRRAVLLVASCMVLLGCAGGDDADAIEALRSEIDARADAEVELARRVDELDETVVGLVEARESDTDAQRLQRTEERLAELEDTLTRIEERLAEGESGRTALTEELETAVGDLRGTLSDVQGDVDGVRGRLEELETLYATLRDRLDRLDVRVSDGGGA